MSEKEKLAALESLFDVKEGTLTPETNLDDVKEYDSMIRLALMVMMEDDFGVKLDGKIIKNFKKVGDILEKMEK